jgi:nucleoside-diphosphate-sugar epimerase
MTAADRRVLVTGAGGFLGRWSVPPLLAAGYDVHAVARNLSDAARNVVRGAVLHGIDLLDAAAVDALLDTVRPSHWLHFAWITTPGVYWQSAENARWVAASSHLLEAFARQGGRRAVLAGSCAEYDWSQVGVCVENSSPLADLESPHTTRYAAAKLDLQHKLAAFGATYGISTAWGRVFFQYGPDEHRERLVASVINLLLRGQPAPASHGRQVRGFLHSADVGAAFAALLDCAVSGPVNIGSDQPVSIAALLAEIGAQIGRPDLIELGARQPGLSEPPLLIADTRRLREEVGWEPYLDLKSGLADTIAWWRSQSALGLHARPA